MKIDKTKFYIGSIIEPINLMYELDTMELAEKNLNLLQATNPQYSNFYKIYKGSDLIKSNPEVIDNIKPSSAIINNFSITKDGSYVDVLNELSGCDDKTWDKIKSEFFKLVDNLDKPKIKYLKYCPAKYFGFDVMLINTDIDNVDILIKRVDIPKLKSKLGIR